MKKTFLWMAAAIMTCGLAFTACSVSDNPNPAPDPTDEIVPLVIDFEDETSVDVFVPNKLNYEIVKDETTENGTNVAKFTYAGKGFCFATFSMKDLENATSVSVSYDFCFPASIAGQAAIVLGDEYVENEATGGFNIGNPQYGFGANGAIFYLGASRGKVNGANQNYFWVNGVPVASTISEEGRTADDMWGKWFHVDMNVNVTEKTLDFVVSHKDEVWFEAKDSAFISNAAETCTQLGVFLGNAGSILIDNVDVTKKASDPNIKYADYTIKFVDTDGNALPEDLKPALTRRGKVGSAITLLDSDKATFKNGDGSITYNYVSDDATNAVVTAEGTVITVVYQIEQMKTYKYRLNLRLRDKDGNIIKRISYIDGEQFEGQTVQIGYYASYFFEGVWYTTPVVDNAKNGIGRYYTFTGNEDKNSQDVCQKDIYYDPDESYVYIAEFEDPTLMTLVGSVTNTNWGSFNGGLFTRFSGGLCAKLAADSYMYTQPLAGGTYQVGIYTRCDNGKTAPGVITLGYVLNGEYTPLNLASAELADAFCNWTTIDNVVIPEGASLAVYNDGRGNNLSLDLLTIIKQPVSEE